MGCNCGGKKTLAPATAAAPRVSVYEVLSKERVVLSTHSSIQEARTEAQKNPGSFVRVSNQAK